MKKVKKWLGGERYYLSGNKYITSVSNTNFGQLSLSWQIRKKYNTLPLQV